MTAGSGPGMASPEQTNDVTPESFLDRQRVMTVATLDPDGLPHAASLPYRREDGELYIAVAPASRTARNLGAVGPVAGTIDDRTSPTAALSLQLRGSAELIADPEVVARLAAGAPAPPGEVSIYRIVADELRFLRDGADTGAETGPAAASAFLNARLEERSAAPGETIVRQGVPADRFYVIVSGACEVAREGGAGRQALARLGPGQFFGETGLLAGVPRTATVTALEATRTLTLSRANFRAALAEVAPTAEGLARAIYEGLRTED